MLEHALLREQFEELLAQERQALAACEGLLEKLEDPELRSQVEQLRREKQRHVDLTERLLEIVD